MAVPQRKKSRSARDMRRAHDGLKSGALSVDQETGEIHRRHHITDEGYYRGKQVVAPAMVADAEAESDDS